MQVIGREGEGKENIGKREKEKNRPHYLKTLNNVMVYSMCFFIFIIVSLFSVFSHREQDKKKIPYKLGSRWTNNGPTS